MFVFIYIIEIGSLKENQWRQIIAILKLRILCREVVKPVVVHSLVA